MKMNSGHLSPPFSKGGEGGFHWIASSLALLAMTVISCIPKNAGQLTLINSGIEPIKVYVDERSFSIRPTGHITKDVSPGPHQIKVDDAAPIEVNIQKELTTVFDSSGLSCFAVIDFSQRSQGGNPQVIEKIENKQIFTTKEPMTAVLGSYLPKKAGPSDKVLRLHQLDCEILPDDLKIISEVSNLP